MDINANMGLPSQATKAVADLAQGGGALALNESGAATRGDQQQTIRTPQDVVTVSDKARALRATQVTAKSDSANINAERFLNLGQGQAANLQFRPQTASSPELLATPEQSKEIDQRTTERLSTSDRRLQADRSATFLAGGSIATAPDFVYKRGPDGRRFAVDGHVAISIGEGQNPAETIARARRIRSAAVFSTGDTNRDITLANHAQQLAVQAHREITAIRAQESAELDKEIGFGKESAPTAPDAGLPGEKAELKFNVSTATMDKVAQQFVGEMYRGVNPQGSASVGGASQEALESDPFAAGQPAEELTFDPFQSSGNMAAQQKATDMQLLNLRQERSENVSNLFEKANVGQRIEQYKDTVAAEVQKPEKKEIDTETPFS